MPRFGLVRRSRSIAHAAWLLSPLLLAAPAAAAPAEIGVWLDHDGKGAIEIAPCGPALCGRIVWLKNPLNDEGKPLFDRRNPDETKRGRTICGLPIIGNLQRTSDGWDNGWIYSPEKGEQYDLYIAAATPDRLTITGYKGIKLFSETHTWTRAPADLPRCSDPQSKAAAPGAAAPTAGAAVPKAPGKPAAPVATKAPPAPKPAVAPTAKSQGKAPAQAAKAPAPPAKAKQAQSPGAAPGPAKAGNKAAASPGATKTSPPGTAKAPPKAAATATAPAAKKPAAKKTTADEAELSSTAE